MSYVQVCKEYVVDQDTFTFLHANELMMRGKDRIDIPPYLWRVSGAAEQAADAIEDHCIGWPTNMTNHVSLNKLAVAFNIAPNYVEILIKFFDKKSWDDKVITAKYQTAGTVAADVALVNYEITVDGKTTAFQYVPTKPRWSFPQFCHVTGLSHFKLSNIGNAFVPFGLMPWEWHAMYQDRPMGGACFALLCGTCAVLLDDKLSFDSFCLLNGVSASRDDLPEINIGKFIYTVNTYVAKFIAIGK